MRRVVIESPFRGKGEDGVLYAIACIRHSISLGEAPFASHLFYTQILDDKDMAQRKLGMELGFKWLRSCDLSAAYTDLGLSPGMQVGISRAKSYGVKCVSRSIGADWRNKWVPDSGGGRDWSELLARVL